MQLFASEYAGQSKSVSLLQLAVRDVVLYTFAYGVWTGQQEYKK